VSRISKCGTTSFRIIWCMRPALHLPAAGASATILHVAFSTKVKLLALADVDAGAKIMPSQVSSGRISDAVGYVSAASGQVSDAFHLLTNCEVKRPKVR